MKRLFGWGSQELVLLPLSKKCFVFDEIHVATTEIFKR
jgi:hypothetical protein